MSAKQIKKTSKKAAKTASAKPAAKKRPAAKSVQAKKAAKKTEPAKKPAKAKAVKPASKAKPAKTPAKPKKVETKKVAKKTVAVKPQAKKTAKAPVAKKTAKQPVAKKQAKAPVAKKPAKATVTKKPVKAPAPKPAPAAKKPVEAKKPAEPKKEPVTETPAPAPVAEQPVKRKRGRPPKNPLANPADKPPKRKYTKRQDQSAASAPDAQSETSSAPADAQPVSEDPITDSIVKELQNQDKSFVFEFAQQMVHQQVKDLREREKAAKKVVKLDDKPISRSEKRKTTQFLKADLALFKEKLLQLRDELLGQSTNLRSAALEQSDERTQEDDDGTDTHMKLQALGMVGSQNSSIQSIDKALRKIEDGTFGICESCGQLIRRKRLEENPQADLCVECQQEHEKGL